MRTLVAIPVYNEENTLRSVVERVLMHAGNVLVVDDGSTDASTSLLPRLPVDIIRHTINRGYGRSIRDAFAWAMADGYDWVITMDCDLQHEPDELPNFFDRIHDDCADVISGSRYLPASKAEGLLPPHERRRVNTIITRELNERLSSRLGVLTDAFCGYKAFRVDALRSLNLSEDGYAFPLQFWVQAAARRLRVAELPVTLIYNDPNRSFGEGLDIASVRLEHYRRVLHRELSRQRDDLEPEATRGVCCCCR
ncbi:MAG: glycosyltransferase family 2 protein [Phycisphaerales bacterium]|nr:glycosyltransferase family 2 protein [Phycisphaerales bacterium]